MVVKCSLCEIDVSPSHEADDVPLCDNHLRFNPELNKSQNIDAALQALHDAETHKDYVEYAKTKLEIEQHTIGGENLLLNSSFESGTSGNPENWSKVTQNNDGATWEAGTAGGNTRSGDYALRVSTPTGGWAVWQQSLSAQANTDYYYSVWFKGTVPGSSTYCLKVSWYNSVPSLLRDDIFYMTPGTYATWQSFEASSTSPANTVAVNVAVGTNPTTGGDVYFDDIVFRIN